jgi:parvulin-like peptidyl-prolyl isomerase
VGAKSGQTKKQAGTKRLVLALFAAIFVLLFVGFAIAQGLTGPSVASGDVAHISSVPDENANVSEAELKRSIFQREAASETKKRPKPGSKEFEALQTAVLTELIESVWLAGQAEELGITVTEKQIENELANIKKQNFPTEKAYQEFLKTAHYTQDEVNEKVELTILSNKVQEKVTAEVGPASNSEIEAYYEAEKATQFTEKPTRDVRVIVNKDKGEVEKAKEALEKDDSPASWEKVAAQYSSDPTTKSKGGLQKAIPEEILSGPLKKAIYGSEKGELVGPTNYQGQYLLTEVVELNPEKEKSLGEVRSQISSTLTQEKQQKYFAEFAESYRARWVARTVCASGFEVSNCSNYPSSARLAKAREPYKSCFEANPKKPPTECPASVEQTKPALPGTVTTLKPKGEPFVQRPQPGAAAATAGAASEAPEGAAPEGAPEASPETGE